MNRRAIPALVLLLAAFAALFVVGRDTVASPAPVFSSPAGTWMPSVTDAGSLTGSWFCPGIPATGEDGVGGSVVISNRESEQLEGRFMVMSPQGLEAEQGFTVGPWSQSTIDVDAFVTTSFASVVVEIDGGRGYVEQIANHPAGDSVAACASETSNEWYLADGFTAGGSIETLILTNPYDDLVLTDLAFATESGSSQPNAFQGFPVPAKSVKVIAIAELGNRDEPIIAASITTRGGRLVVVHNTSPAAAAGATTCHSPPRRCATSGGSLMASAAQASPRRSRFTTRPTEMSRSTCTSWDSRLSSTVAASHRSISLLVRW
jgi:hypothetical protein